ncbi:MAG: hypothetical protein HC890_00160 [Chloroflexaceae bacterium]|nr:hypothetical protein [Chloroflexaceae bacterium]
MTAATQAQNNRYFRPASQDEETLYDHLRDLVQRFPPERVLDDFQTLFIKGKYYANESVFESLRNLVSAPQAEEEFKYILNRCCHILVNHWQMYPHYQPAVPKLIDLFEELSSIRNHLDRNSSRLRQLMIGFIESDQFLKLQRLARVVGRDSPTSIGNLINRYPYLYEHCLLCEDTSFEHLQTVKYVKKRIQRRFEVDISRYLTYKTRQTYGQSTAQWQSSRIIQPVVNPTLLSDRELERALAKFTGPIEQGYTCRDLSQRFISHGLQASSYREFKDDLYRYLITSIDPAYGQHQFNQKLYHKIHEILPQCDGLRPDEFLLVRTSSQLLNFLVVESSSRLEHYVFADLITNLGATNTITLLLKITLLCSKICPYLEKRLAILFSHYESFSHEGVPWLIKALENLQIALSLHFGRLDISGLEIGRR